MLRLLTTCLTLPLLGACLDRAEDAAPAPATDDAVAADAAPSETTASDETMKNEANTELATFGAGCFWCVEAVLEQLDGVLDVRSGYAGGTTPDPTYQEVCTGRTGHAEVVQVRFDPDVISYDELLDWFWRLHDPTTLNRQGPDEGTQYRSAIFTSSEAQREAAERSKRELEQSGRFADPIVTEITPLDTFWPAEDYHQDYYRQNRAQGYCRVVIAPKLDKLGLED